MANDPVQILREAIVAVLDTRPEIAAITGRNAENVVAWGSIANVADDVRRDGIIAYHVLPFPEIAADQNAADIPVQFGAIAGDEATANELINLVRRFVKGQYFQALGAPLDIVVLARDRRPFPFDPDEGLARADTDLTIRAYFPALV